MQQWFAAIWVVTQENPGVTSVALGKELNITQKTAWFMIQRIKSYYPIEKVASKKTKKIVAAKNPVMPSNFEKVSVDSNKMDMLEWLKMLKK